MLFNQSLSASDINELVKASAFRNPRRTFFTLLASPSFITSLDVLSEFVDAGLSAVKFHSYQQNITSDRFPEFLRIAEWAQALNLPILIDASYGSLDMYRCDNLRLVADVAQVVKSVPIVILHSGGARALDALLLAESSPNIFLETSFSLDYYFDSRVCSDIAFAYKKIGYRRVCYASDHPYISSDRSLSTALRFCDKFGVSADDVESLFNKTFSRIFSCSDEL